MKTIKRYLFLIMMGLLLSAWVVAAGASVLVQCPGDSNGDAIVDSSNPIYNNVKCMHIGAGDGAVRMADGRDMYMFGFSDLTGITDNPDTPHDERMTAGMMAATFPAPKIVLDQGDEFYLTLTNVGMMMRPDLFDPHTVHWHGFPEAAPVFDGVPDASVSINMGASFTYYYNVVEPGTYMYHCHVEATEHMQMGMLGNLYVRPAQDGTVYSYQGKSYSRFAYNDNDGSTGYDVDYAIQLGSFDSAFHDASEMVQPLPFALMRDNYPMINGRGYPDTASMMQPMAPMMANPRNGVSTQPEHSLITANQGDRVLLRLSNLNITRFYTLTSLSIPMEVVGRNARHYRGPDGKNLYYTTSSVTMGGGESIDVILDTTDIPPGTYFLYTTNMNYLSNDTEDFGGMMTEIIVN
ncbi:MAG: multicopper oxidase family protein [Desulfobacteraceae bacterium]|nr:MAG: multicopper oxidase family protein [Desulfobacteraceae bacterium]